MLLYATTLNFYINTENHPNDDSRPTMTDNRKMANKETYLGGITQPKKQNIKES